jgi:hypothetical protein
MSENSIISIRNGIIASVVAGVILMVVPTLRNYAVSFFLWVWSGVLWCWNALAATYALPGWAWLATIALALVGCINIFLAIKGDAREPEYKRYIEDYLYNANWRWNWVGSQLSNLWCFCPRCDATLVYNDSSCHNYYAEVKKTDFICENCNNNIVSSIKGGDKDYALSAAEREIHRRIRTGEHKKH